MEGSAEGRPVLGLSDGDLVGAGLGSTGFFVGMLVGCDDGWGDGTDVG